MPIVNQVSLMVNWSRCITMKPGCGSASALSLICTTPMAQSEFRIFEPKGHSPVMRYPSPSRTAMLFPALTMTEAMRTGLLSQNIRSCTEAGKRIGKRDDTLDMTVIQAALGQ